MVSAVQERWSWLIAELRFDGRFQKFEEVALLFSAGGQSGEILRPSWCRGYAMPETTSASDPPAVRPRLLWLCPAAGFPADVAHALPGHRVSAFHVAPVSSQSLAW